MQPSNERPLLLRTNYILIDYENVQVKSLDRLQNEQFKVLIFLGPTNTKLPVDLVLSVQRLGDRAQYILLGRPVLLRSNRILPHHFERHGIRSVDPAPQEPKDFFCPLDFDR